MKKAEFIRKFKEDYDFRFDMKRKGIKVVGDNVIFFNLDGTIKCVAGAYVK